ncbi:hypothetical protein HK102_002594, partial [Quaeritorhiza haematococci]
YLQLRQLQVDGKVRLTGDLGTPPANASLLTISNKYGYVVFGTNTGFGVAFTKDIIKVFTDGPEKKVLEFRSSKNITVQDESDAKVLHLKLSADELTIVVGLTNGYILLYDVPSIVHTENASTVSFTHRVQVGEPGSVIDLLPNPEAYPDVCAVLSTDAVRIVKLSGEVTPLPLPNVTAICWSPKGKQLVCGLVDGTLKQVTIDGTVKNTMNPPSLGFPAKVDTILWLENKLFAVIYVEKVEEQPQVSACIISTESGTTKYTKIEDPAISFNDSRKTHYLFSHLKSWGKDLKYLLFIANAASTDVGVIAGLSNNWGIWDLMDTSRVTMPLNAEDNDTLPVGIVVDCTSTIGLPPPSPDDPPIEPCPILLVMNNEGLLLAYHVVNLDAVKKREKCEAMVGGVMEVPAPSTRGAAPKPAPAPFKLPTTKPGMLGAGAATTPQFGTPTTLGGGSFLPPASPAAPFGSATAAPTPQFGAPTTLGGGSFLPPASPAAPFGSATKASAGESGKIEFKGFGAALAGTATGQASALKPASTGFSFGTGDQSAKPQTSEFSFGTGDQSAKPATTAPASGFSFAGASQTTKAPFSFPTAPAPAPKTEPTKPSFSFPTAPVPAPKTEPTKPSFSFAGTAPAASKNEPAKPGFSFATSAAPAPKPSFSLPAPTAPKPSVAASSSPPKAAPFKIPDGAPTARTLSSKPSIPSLKPLAAASEGASVQASAALPVAPVSPRSPRGVRRPSISFKPGTSPFTLESAPVASVVAPQPSGKPPSATIVRMFDQLYIDFSKEFESLKEYADEFSSRVAAARKSGGGGPDTWTLGDLPAVVKMTSELGASVAKLSELEKKAFENREGLAASLLLVQGKKEECHQYLQVVCGEVDSKQVPVRVGLGPEAEELRRRLLARRKDLTHGIRAISEYLRHLKEKIDQENRGGVKKQPLKAPPWETICRSVQRITKSTVATSDKLDLLAERVKSLSLKQQPGAKDIEGFTPSKQRTGMLLDQEPQVGKRGFASSTTPHSSASKRSRPTPQTQGRRRVGGYGLLNDDVIYDEADYLRPLGDETAWETPSKWTSDRGQRQQQSPAGAPEEVVRALESHRNLRNRMKGVLRDLYEQRARSANGGVPVNRTAINPPVSENLLNKPIPRRPAPPTPQGQVQRQEVFAVREQRSPEVVQAPDVPSPTPAPAPVPATSGFGGAGFTAKATAAPPALFAPPTTKTPPTFSFGPAATSTPSTSATAPTTTTASTKPSLFGAMAAPAGGVATGFKMPTAQSTPFFGAPTATTTATATATAQVAVSAAPAASGTSLFGPSGGFGGFGGFGTAGKVTALFGSAPTPPAAPSEKPSAGFGGGFSFGAPSKDAAPKAPLLFSGFKQEQRQEEDEEEEATQDEEAEEEDSLDDVDDFDDEDDLDEGISAELRELQEGDEGSEDEEGVVVDHAGAHSEEDDDEVEVKELDAEDEGLSADGGTLVLTLKKDASDATSPKKIEAAEAADEGAIPVPPPPPPPPALTPVEAKPEAKQPTSLFGTKASPGVFGGAPLFKAPSAGTKDGDSKKSTGFSFGMSGFGGAANAGETGKGGSVGLFGIPPSTTMTMTTPSLFGSGGSPSTPGTGFMFGKSLATPSGAKSPSETKPSMLPKPTTPSSFGLFGSPPAGTTKVETAVDSGKPSMLPKPAAPSFGLFGTPAGGATKAEATTDSGKPSALPKPAAPSFGLFGSPAGGATKAEAASDSGKPSALPKPVAPSFGLFGAPAAGESKAEASADSGKEDKEEVNEESQKSKEGSDDSKRPESHQEESKEDGPKKSETEPAAPPVTTADNEKGAGATTATTKSPFGLSFGGLKGPIGGAGMGGSGFGAGFSFGSTATTTTTSTSASVAGFSFGTSTTATTTTTQATGTPVKFAGFGSAFGAQNDTATSQETKPAIAAPAVSPSTEGPAGVGEDDSAAEPTKEAAEEKAPPATSKTPEPKENDEAQPLQPSLAAPSLLTPGAPTPAEQDNEEQAGPEEEPQQEEPSKEEEESQSLTLEDDNETSMDAANEEEMAMEAGAEESMVSEQSNGEGAPVIATGAGGGMDSMNSAFGSTGLFGLGATPKPTNQVNPMFGATSPLSNNARATAGGGLQNSGSIFGSTQPSSSFSSFGSVSQPSQSPFAAAAANAPKIGGFGASASPSPSPFGGGAPAFGSTSSLAANNPAPAFGMSTAFGASAGVGGSAGPGTAFGQPAFGSTSGLGMASFGAALPVDRIRQSFSQAGSVFGSSSGAAPGSFGGFAAAANQPTAFGSLAAQPQPSGFAAMASQQQQQPSGFGAFGSQQQSQASSIFGGSSSKPKGAAFTQYRG